MIKIFKFLFAIIRFSIYKPFFRKSSFFVLNSNSLITGLKRIELGRQFYANKLLRMEVFAGGYLKVGDNVNLGQNVHIGVLNYVELGNNVLIGSNVLITDHNHGKYNGIDQDSPESAPNKRKIYSPGKVIIGENVWIGDGVVILPNIVIGSGSIIGSNSVVSKDIPPNVIVGGNPLKIIKYFDEKNNVWLKDI
ncbi:DapH/DapD/GlmU-related protein [Sphingobacterium siyangense]|uniref:Lipopolysaccharide O-acetyltransferase n=1 Tax=Sphingobacterium siyangense TaxID=459529 RepID=A0A562MJF0_9SPHI|nr:DapH/DapD/GlmU-related protein [Sphingobacterium siyangense]TWI19958.1 lipopolysaccharide O-acetyltransferase [Sphingobacterium siyangense]